MISLEEMHPLAEALDKRMTSINTRKRYANSDQMACSAWFVFQLPKSEL